MSEKAENTRDAQRPGEDEKSWKERVAVNQTLDKITNKLMVFSGKGGVGKSTVAANLAVSLAQSGQRVGLLDIDFHGPSIPKLLGVTDKRMDITEDNTALPVIGPSGVKIVSIGFLLPDLDQATIWRGPLKMGVFKQLLGQTEWGELDWLIIDSPPGTGDEPLSVAQTIVGTKGLLVTTPQQIATDDVRRSIGFARKLGMELVGMIENMSGMVCPHCGERIDVFKGGGGKAMAAEVGVRFLGRVPLDPAAVEAGDDGRPVVAAMPDSPTGKALLEAFGPIITSA
ncbi:Mrp/NBP35 family ATP-binding protein [bacterium]|nr:Mrp/NBP35 family ATP-binding protein [bacterium]